jgi:hypothetical protein
MVVRETAMHFLLMFDKSMTLNPGKGYLNNYPGSRCNEFAMNEKAACVVCNTSGFFCKDQAASALGFMNTR